MENSRNKQVKFLVFCFLVFLNHILKYNGYVDIIIINLTKRICFCFSKKFMLVAARYKGVWSGLKCRFKSRETLAKVTTFENTVQLRKKHPSASPVGRHFIKTTLQGIWQSVCSSSKACVPVTQESHLLTHSYAQGIQCSFVAQHMARKLPRLHRCVLNTTQP